MPIACQTVQDLECKFKTYKVIPVFVDSAVNLVFLVSANAFEDHSSQSTSPGMLTNSGRCRRDGFLN